MKRSIRLDSNGLHDQTRYACMPGPHGYIYARFMLAYLTGDSLWVPIIRWIQLALGERRFILLYIYIYIFRSFLPISVHAKIPPPITRTREFAFYSSLPITGQPWKTVCRWFRPINGNSPLFDIDTCDIDRGLRFSLTKAKKKKKKKRLNTLIETRCALFRQTKSLSRGNSSKRRLPLSSSSRTKDRKEGGVSITLFKLFQLIETDTEPEETFLIDGVIIITVIRTRTVLSFWKTDSTELFDENSDGCERGLRWIRGRESE